MYYNMLLFFELTLFFIFACFWAWIAVKIYRYLARPKRSIKTAKTLKDFIDLL